MSRFESSRFARNPQVMNANVLKAACEALGWKYSIQNNILLVTEIGIGSNFYGEFALKLDVLTNEVTYNTFYMPNALEKVEELKEMFQVLNAEYSKNALISEFEKAGFAYRSNFDFTPTEEEKFSFYMEAKSYDPLEDEPFASIKFTILKDGTIVTDSDYLPNDVNEKAHEAMDILELHLGNKRVMTKKPVPAKYVSKMKPRRIINIKQNL